MIVHQTPSKQPYVVGCKTLTHQIEEIVAVIIVLKDQLVSAPFDHNMVMTEFG